MLDRVALYATAFVALFLVMLVVWTGVLYVTFFLGLLAIAFIAADFSNFTEIYIAVTEPIWRITTVQCIVLATFGTFAPSTRDILKEIQEKELDVE